MAAAATACSVGARSGIRNAMPVRPDRASQQTTLTRAQPGNPSPMTPMTPKPVRKTSRLSEPEAMSMRWRLSGWGAANAANVTPVIRRTAIRCRVRNVW